MLDLLRIQEPLDEISLKMLALKVMTPLTLATAARAHELAAIHLDFSLMEERILGVFNSRTCKEL